ncbi:peroxidase 44 [Cajanus cajan]|uniref:Peroxidase n=1 Tax=Cajanus cajan TaxID=3821 RepID=A0A151QR16_CAJCA|nr:peroxidase 44 [Cajanus cajan]KYP32750.1 Peroxidase 44 [Cajanus cajan]
MKITTIIIFFFFVLPFTFAELRVGFYSSTCPSAETIVRDVVQKRFNQDKSIAAALLRMHFHDCFVKGCDASLLIDPTSTRTSEKIAGPNQTVREFELIDEAKILIEQACPSTVSCADILALATRDAVALAGGIRYSVPTGRRDGLLSDPSLVNLPSPSLSVPGALQFFTAKGLTLADMVTLLGAHTVGFAHCSVFQNRLSNVGGGVDPTMDPVLAATLVQICGLDRAVLSDPRVFLDQNSSFLFDNGFYNEVMMRRGILHIDQQLALDKMSRNMVESFAANGTSFQEKFAKAIVKMGTIGALVGDEGEIRRSCRAFNNPL